MDVVADGRQAGEGEGWNVAAAAVFASAQAYVEYDLGAARPVRAGLLQGDNNDEYVVTASVDGQTYRSLWIAPPVAAQGLRARSTDQLSGTARFVRVAGRGGDGSFSVSELQLFSEVPRSLRSSETSREMRAGSARTAMLYLLLAFALALYAPGVAGAAGQGRAALLGGAAVAAALVWTVAAAIAAWPLGARELSFARAAAAAIVLLGLARLSGVGGARAGAVDQPGLRSAPSRRPALALAACVIGAALAFASFFHFGRPQFWHAAANRPLFVHTLDMRVYQPFVRYFSELRYDGVYLASVLAYAEDERGGSLATLAEVQIRDMRTHEMRRVSEVGADIEAIRRRFSDARWADFKRDMSFFRASMGPLYMGSLTDHGANAPPFWVWVARPILGYVGASEGSLIAGALVDVALLLLMAAACAACFGLLPALATMTVFGAAELHMFGTNWVGATLRHDWIVLLGLGACALRVRRYRLAGGLLGVATLLRSVPGVVLLGIGLVSVVAVLEDWARRGRPRGPALRALVGDAVRRQRPAVEVVVAAVATMAAGVLLTGVLYGFGAWGEWWRKVTLVNQGFAVNEVDFRALLAGTDGLPASLLAARRPIQIAAAIAGVVVVAWTGRNRPLHEVGLLSLPLMLVLMNPVNYHAHALFLLGLLGAGAAGPLAAAAPLLVMCVGDYWVSQDPDAARRFEALTAWLFGALAWLYAVVASRGAPSAAPLDEAREASTNPRTEATTASGSSS